MYSTLLLEDVSWLYHIILKGVILIFLCAIVLQTDSPTQCIDNPILCVDSPAKSILAVFSSTNY